MGHWINQTGNKKYLETNENGNSDPKSMQHNKSSLKREVLISGTKKNWNKPPNFTSKELEKQEQAKSNIITKKERKKERKNEDLSGSIWNRLLQK